jgi:hypothetical protein
MAASSRERFDYLKAKWRAAFDKASALRGNLRARYGEYHFQAPRGMRDKADKAGAAQDRASDAIFAWLDAHSPRNWRVGVPAFWTCAELTFEDATTRGKLSLVPPVAWGGVPQDSIRFAAALPERSESFAW